MICYNAKWFQLFLFFLFFVLISQEVPHKMRALTAKRWPTHTDRPIANADEPFRSWRLWSQVANTVKTSWKVMKSSTARALPTDTLALTCVENTKTTKNYIQREYLSGDPCIQISHLHVSAYYWDPCAQGIALLSMCFFVLERGFTWDRLRGGILHSFLHNHYFLVNINNVPNIKYIRSYMNDLLIWTNSIYIYYRSTQTG